MHAVLHPCTTVATGECDTHYKRPSATHKY